MSRKAAAWTVGATLLVGLIGGNAAGSSGNADDIDQLTAENAQISAQLETAEDQAAAAIADAEEARAVASESEAVSAGLQEQIDELGSVAEAERQKAADAIREADEATALVAERDARIGELEAAAAAVPAVQPEQAPPAVESNVYYKNCSEARAAGAAPVRLGQPGYGSHLDRDGDGVGCE
jgi:micrococcal nuclease